jgi:hypothetical protein
LTGIISLTIIKKPELYGACARCEPF